MAPPKRTYLKREVTHPAVSNKGVADIVQGIIGRVHSEGESAVRELCKKFDKWEGEILVSRESMETQFHRVSEQEKKDIHFAHDRIRRFAEAQAASVHPVEIELEPGLVAGHQVLPVECAGCYVPGGRFAHVASALMTVATAKAAGVKYTVACSPPKDKNGIHPAVLYALHVAGCDYVLTVGGAQGLAAMAYGLFTGHRADVLVGPGNRFVVEAKRQLFGEVGIDLIAGPTETCVLADSTADPMTVATDLMSQAEHGPDSPCVLVTTDLALGRKVLELMGPLIDSLPEKNREAATVSWRDYGEVIVVETREDMAVVSDDIASEHLEVHCADLEWYKANLRNYGSLFLGEATTVTMGDKCSGPNHVLPTRKAARYTGGLSAHKFLKTVSYQTMTPSASRNVGLVSARDRKSVV